METPIEGPQFDWKCREPHERTTRGTAAAMAAVTPRTLAAAIADPNEKLVGKNNLRSITFLDRGIQLSRAVAHISIPGVGAATGFLIDTDVLLTNNHVFGSPAEARDAIIKFNYQNDLDGNLLPTEEYRCDPSDLFHTNAALDYSIVRIKDSPGSRWGAIPIPSGGAVGKGDDVIIIQHPGGMPKQIALTDNEVMYVDDAIAQYLTDTMPGSSGSPVFNDKWNLIALHHSGGWIPEPTTGSTHFRNEGIRITAIRDDMPSW